MLKKQLVLGILSSITFFCYASGASAAQYGAPKNNINTASYGKVNNQAWRQFTNERKLKYQRDHTIDKAPFPRSIEGGKVLKVDLGKRAWAAYDDNGQLLKWGSASGGRDFCPDIGQKCRTVTGTYTFYSRKGSKHKSNLYPRPNGGAPMPYCMHFHGSYALHGGPVPDFNASHGCIRVPVVEAQWINQNFVKVGQTKIKINY